MLKYFTDVNEVSDNGDFDENVVSWCVSIVHKSRNKVKKMSDSQLVYRETSIWRRLINQNCGSLPHLTTRIIFSSPLKILNVDLAARCQGRAA